MEEINEFIAFLGELVTLRSYRRKDHELGIRESFVDMVTRVICGLSDIGKQAVTPAELNNIVDQLIHKKSFPSGRGLWVLGTDWVKESSNYDGLFNCKSLTIKDIPDMAKMMDLAMMGCGTGAVLGFDDLPPIDSKPIELIEITPVDGIGSLWNRSNRHPHTVMHHAYRVPDESDNADVITLGVGDSRAGWVTAYEMMFELATTELGKGATKRLVIDLRYVRGKGQPLRGFGGVANPTALPHMFTRMVEIFNGALGRRLTISEVCLLIDEAAAAVVAGNIRRSAGMRQGDRRSEEFATLKDNLWQKDDQGNWSIDPKRDALRMANHTCVFHDYPTKEDILKSVTSQFLSGEGAIQFAPEAIARANADLLGETHHHQFVHLYCQSPEKARAFLEILQSEEWGDLSAIDSLEFQKEMDHRMGRYGLNPCFAAGTMITTRKGHFPIESLVGKTVEVWDGDNWVIVDNFRVTGQDQPVYTLTLQDGSQINTTAYHTFILEDGIRKQLHELKPGDRLLASPVIIEGDVETKGAYFRGFMITDEVQLIEDKRRQYPPRWCVEEKLMDSILELEPKLIARATRFSVESVFYDGVPHKKLEGLEGLDSCLIKWVHKHRDIFPMEVLNWKTSSKLEFIAGVLDGAGVARGSDHEGYYQINSINHAWLLGFQMLLKTLGVQSQVGPNDRQTQYLTDLPLYELRIIAIDAEWVTLNCDLQRLKRFQEEGVTFQDMGESSWNQVASIDFARVEPQVYCCSVQSTHTLAVTNASILTGNCGEIISKDFSCNLSEVHLNIIHPLDLEGQIQAFEAAATSATILLSQGFTYEKFDYSQKVDPIVGVSFTGLFDFFVNAFGVQWLRWWQSGRPGDWDVDDVDLKRHLHGLLRQFSAVWDGTTAEQLTLSTSSLFTFIEQEYLSTWREIVERKVTEICLRNGWKVPNRSTTVQPAGSKSLITGACPGWHKPKAPRYLRRITFDRLDPIAQAARAFGFPVIPSQSCKTEDGQLLTDPDDPRVTEWLIEVPIELPWANLPGVDDIDINQFSALAQFDFYMQVQKHYTRHNTSATIELREHEIEGLADRIHTAIMTGEGYVSATLLSCSDAAFPTLPFQPITKEEYDRLTGEIKSRQKGLDFDTLLKIEDQKVRDFIQIPTVECGGGECRRG